MWHEWLNFIYIVTIVVSIIRSAYYEDLVGGLLFSAAGILFFWALLDE